MTVADVVREVSAGGRWFVYATVFVEVYKAEVADGRLRLWVPGANEYWANDMGCTTIERLGDGIIRITSPLTVVVPGFAGATITRAEHTTWFLLREDQLDRQFRSV